MKYVDTVHLDVILKGGLEVVPYITSLYRSETEKYIIRDVFSEILHALGDVEDMLHLKLMF